MSGVTFIAPVNCSPGTVGSFQDVDADSFATVPANCSGVILRIHNDGGTTHAFGARKNGSTDNRTGSIRHHGRQGVFIGVDAGNIFEINIAHADVKVYIIGFHTGDAVFFTNATQASLSSGSFQDWNIAALTGDDTAIAAYLEWQAATFFAARKNGSTDDRMIMGQSHEWLCVPVDGSEILEAHRASGNDNPFIVGYIKSDYTGNTNAIERSRAATGSYADLAAASSGAIAVVWEIISGGGADTTYGIRKNGATDDNQGHPGGDSHCWDIVECDSGQICEGIIDDLTIDFFESAIFTAAGGGSAIVRVINETEQVSEASLRKLGLVRLRGETVQATEALLRFLGIARARNETAEVPEASLGVLGVVRAIAETVQVHETSVSVLGFVRSRDETVDLSESRAPFLGRIRAVGETVDISEASLKALGRLRVRDETVNLSGTQVRVIGLVRTLEESVSVSEAVARFMGLLRSANETTELSEARSRILGFGRPINESVSVSETVALVHGIAAIINETVSLAEAIIKILSVVNTTVYTTAVRFSVSIRPAVAAMFAIKPINK